jgi:hypothetical protein
LGNKEIGMAQARTIPGWERIVEVKAGKGAVANALRKY